MKKHSTLKNIINLIAEHKLSVVISVLCSMITALCALAVPLFVGRSIDCAVAKGQVDFDSLLINILFIGVFALAYSLFGYIAGVINNHIAYEVGYKLRSEASKKIAHLPISTLDKKNKGEVLSHISTDVEIVSDGLQIAFANFVNCITTIVGALVVMFIYSPIVAACVFALTPISIFVASKLTHATHGAFVESTNERAKQTSIIDRYVSARKLVAAYSKEDEVCEIFDKQNDKYGKINLKALFLSSLTNPSTRLINNIIYALIAAGGAFGVLGGVLTIGRLSTFLAYSVQYTKPLNEISGVITEIQNGMVCAGKIFEFLALEEEVEPAELSNLAQGQTHSIKLQNVAFSYGERPLIKNLNLDIKPGEHIAIVGPTGCGKTTLINLLMRFYDVNDGAITIDGVDIRDISRSNLRSMFGMVLQDTWLCHGTVAENISYGKDDATRDEIIEAAKSCHAHSFISRLPQGYDTIIGGEDDGLSGGQKQLLCIARVMLRHPEILILDEATSNVDTATEKRVQRAFAKLCEGKTSFIVAHRLSTIVDCDRIIVMKDGDVVEIGSHTELLANGGFYAELYNSRIV